MLRVLIACLILLAPISAHAKYWNGSEWVATTAKRWDGAAWSAVAEKRWSGTEWATLGGESADYCADKLGSYSLYYDADHPLGDTTACITGGTATVIRTAIDPTATTGSNMTSGGTYGTQWTGACDKNITIPVGGLTSGNGRVAFKIKAPSSLPATGSYALWEWSTTTSKVLYAYVQVSGSTFRLKFYHNGGSLVDGSIATYITLTADAEYDVILDWNATTGKTYAMLGSSSFTSTAGTVTAFDAGTLVPAFGERLQGNCTVTMGFGFDNILTGASQQ